MSEISAVVLSVGEPSTQRAIDSLAAQSIPLRKIIVVEHVSPFFRAINQGARQVTTPFFVQVDADMILDPRCAEVLLQHTRDDIGIVVAELRDPLFGQTVGVKLFRTACFQNGTMPDSISPDTDFVTAQAKSGWRTSYVEAPAGEAATRRPTLGEHRPDYTPSYLLRKQQLEGGRLRHRAARHGLLWEIDTLKRSPHPLAMLAQLALCHGLFLRWDRDELKPPAFDPRGEGLMTFLAGDRRAGGFMDELLPLTCHSRLRDVFRRFAVAGHALGRDGAGATFRELFAETSDARNDARALVARIALGHGLLLDEVEPVRLAQDERLCREFILLGLGSRSSPWDHLRARVRRLLLPSRRKAPAPW